MKRLPSFFLVSGLIAVCLLFIINCKKEYSYEGGRDAVYSFVGTPLTCTDATVTGDFYKGIATVDSVNSVRVQVDITTPGKYDISTLAVDGISFSASGEFEDTASDYVVQLHGTGTPDSAGTFTFLIPGTKGCSFSVTVNEAQANAVYTVSGAPDDCANPVEQGRYMMGVPMTAANVVTLTVNVLSPGPYGITTDQINNIYFSASGNFTSTGTQPVVLQANRTPEVAELSAFRVNAFDVNASHCTFYVPVGNAEPVATYVLQSAIQNNIVYCTPGSVQGAYTAGTELTAGNTLTVNAYVTMPGNYTISTIGLNGIKFAASGTFATIGAQDVVLKGSGTPDAIGTYTFYPQIVGPAPLGGSTCGLDIEVK